MSGGAITRDVVSGPVRKYSIEVMIDQVRRAVDNGEDEVLLSQVNSGELGRGLHVAIGEDMKRSDNYDPELDVRVEYVRQVIRSLRSHGVVRVDGDVSACVDWLLDEERTGIPARGCKD